MSPATASPWTGLPSDLLLEVVGRLRDAVEVVRFHAVCRPWRDAAVEAALLAPAATYTACLPWVLRTHSGNLVHSVVNFRCSLETTAYRRSHDVVLQKPLHDASGTNDDDMNWVATVDGTATWLFVARPSPRLINLLTGAVAPLPPFPDDAGFSRPYKKFRGILYGDGTLFLYSFNSEIRWNPSMPDFTAAILRPGGDAAWTVVEKRLNLPTAIHRPYDAAYHDGKILACTGGHSWCVLTPGFEASGGGDIGGMLVPRLEETEDAYYFRVRSYVLVSGGELLRASVVVVDRSLALSVTVHALQEEPGGSGEMRWVARDIRSSDNRVLFLGTSASFAAQWDSEIACAYFVIGGSVYRYNFDQGEAKIAKWLGLGWKTDEPILWLRPILSFAPIQKIRERLEDQKKEVKNR